MFVCTHYLTVYT